jgi:hypothetical protein
MLALVSTITTSKRRIEPSTVKRQHGPEEQREDQGDERNAQRGERVLPTW